MRSSTNSANMMGLANANFPSLGDSLRLDGQGMLGVNDAATFLWTGSHHFTRPLFFSVEQALSTSLLSCEDQSHGDILGFIRGKGWSRIPASPVAGRVFVWSAGLPTWGLVDLAASVQGVLSIKQGGTGLSEWEKGSLLVGGNLLLSGQEGDILTVDTDGGATWHRPSGLRGQGDPYTLAIWGADNNLISLPIHAGLNGSLSLVGPLLFEASESGVEAKTNSLTLYCGETNLVIKENNISLQDDLGVAWFRFSADKGLEIGSVGVDHIKGILPTDKGGTGQSRLRRGDLLVAASDAEWNRLSVPSQSEGFVLSLVDGLPIWASPNNAASRPMSTVKLAAGGSDRPPLLFTSGTLTSSPQAGALEWGTEGLYFTASESSRRRLLFEGEDIKGTASMVREIVPLSLGGLSTDVSRFPDNALFCKIGGEIHPFSVGEAGQTLITENQNGILQFAWRKTLHSLSVTPQGGILLDDDTPDSPRLRLDFGLNAEWTGTHRFRNAVQMNDGAFVGALVLRALTAPPDPKPGLFWFDGQTVWIWANGRAQNLLGGSSVTESPKESHYLSLCAAVSVAEPRQLRRSRVTLPYAASDGVTPRQWRIRRFTARLDDGETPVRVGLRINGVNALEPTLLLATDSPVETTEFTHTVARSGEDIWVETILEDDSADPGYLSCWLLIEAL